MAIIDYGTLKTAVQDLFGRDTDAMTIPQLIELGEHRLYSELRVRFMEFSATVVASSGVQTSALPQDYLKARSIYITGTPTARLEFRTPTEIWDINADLPTGKPTVFTVEGENIEWGPIPDALYTARVNYYKRPASLVADADTNGLFTLAPQLLLYAAMIEGSPRLSHDTRTLTFAALFDDLLEKVHAADVRDRYSGDTLAAERQAQMT